MDQAHCGEDPLPLIKLNWGWIALRGVFAVLFGILAITRPGLTIAALVIVFGVYAIIDGVYLCFSAIAERHNEPNWALYLLGGLAGFAAGVATLSMPGITAVVLLYVVAAWAIVRGVIEIVAAIRLRKIIHGEAVYVIAGMLSLIFGFLLIARPAMGTLLLMAWVGAYAILFGIILLIVAFKVRKARDILAEL
jgi:uncharacterized membrane protein HdeD (DUF308 family)